MNVPILHAQFNGYKKVDFNAKNQSPNAGFNGQNDVRNQGPPLMDTNYGMLLINKKFLGAAQF